MLFYTSIHMRYLKTIRWLKLFTFLVNRFVREYLFLVYMWNFNITTITHNIRKESVVYIIGRLRVISFLQYPILSFFRWTLIINIIGCFNRFPNVHIFHAFPIVDFATFKAYYSAMNVSCVFFSFSFISSQISMFSPYVIYRIIFHIFFVLFVLYSHRCLLLPVTTLKLLS